MTAGGKRATGRTRMRRNDAFVSSDGVASVNPGGIRPIRAGLVFAARRGRDARRR
jgi:hypothetical protein